MQILCFLTPEILQKEFSTDPKNHLSRFLNKWMKKDNFLQETNYFMLVFSYGCSGVLVNWITNEYEETPMEIAMQLFRLAKDTELYSYRLYAKEELEEQ